MLALAAGGCGQEPTISAGDGEAALAALDGVERAYADGRCTVANQRASNLSVQIGDLPSNTDPELTRALQRSADRLADLVAGQCEQAEQIEEPTAPVLEPTSPAGEQGKGKDKQKDKPPKENGNGQGNEPPSEQPPPPEEQPPGEDDDDSGGVTPGDGLGGGE